MRIMRVRVGYGGREGAVQELYIKFSLYFQGLHRSMRQLVL